MCKLLPELPYYTFFFFEISFQVWLYLNLFRLEETDYQIAQVTTENEKLRKLIAVCPSEVPQSLKICTVINHARVFPQKLKDHAKFNEPQVWIVDRKRDKKTATCSGCLEMGVIKQDDLHLSVKGLYYVEQNNHVVESTL